jgi:hypothetical protein
MFEDSDSNDEDHEVNSKEFEVLKAAHEEDKQSRGGSE